MLSLLWRIILVTSLLHRRSLAEATEEQRAPLAFFSIQAYIHLQFLSSVISACYAAPRHASKSFTMKSKFLLNIGDCHFFLKRSWKSKARINKANTFWSNWFWKYWKCFVNWNSSPFHSPNAHTNNRSAVPQASIVSRLCILLHGSGTHRIQLS